MSRALNQAERPGWGPGVVGETGGTYLRVQVADKQH